MQAVWSQFLSVVIGLAGQVVTPGVSIYWPYLLSALALALVVGMVGHGHRDPKSLWRFCFPKRVWRNPNVRQDLGLFVVNALLFSFLFIAPLNALSTRVAHVVWLGLGDNFASPAFGQAWVFRGALTLALFVAADFAFFVNHVLAHRIPVLWEFHKVHHSAEQLQPFAVFRRHPVDAVLEGAISGLIIGPVHGVFGWASGGEPSVFAIQGVNVLLYLGLLLGFNLQHSHVWLSFGPLDRVFVSPATHQIHHSSDPAHHDRNFGNLLAVWDLALGTLVRPSKPVGSFGLGGGERDYRGLLRPLFLPFLRAGSVFLRIFRRPARPG